VINHHFITNKPAKLGDVEFFYNANDDRYKKTEGNKTTHHIGKTYEKEISSNTHRYFIYANGKVVAIYDSTYKSIYLHYDALNSVDTITDTQGTVVQRKAYSAYGKEITTDDFFPYSTKRGYTGHEHIDDSLIHMNGRVYDSAIGRFISADPNIFHPFDPQDFNRYAYVRNNPLKYTDPSGFSWLSKAWKKVVKTVKKYKKVIIAIAAAAITGGAAFTAMGGGFWGAVVGGAVGGATSGAIMTGSLSGAMKGAVFGGISGGVAFGVAELAGSHSASFFEAAKQGNWAQAGGKAVLHGITRAVITKAQGGRYSSGFWSGFASSRFSVGSEGYGGFTSRTVIMGVVGGTTSRLTGGNFANGAVSGAFVHMFNAEGMRKLANYFKSQYPIAYDKNLKLKDMRGYHESTPNYNNEDVVNFFDKTAERGGIIAAAGVAAKNPLMIAWGEGIDITASSFKIIADKKTYQPYEVYNAYAPPWLTITPLK